MLSILGSLFIGLFIGSIGQAFMPGEEPRRIDGAVLLGMCGALIGGLISGSPFRAGQGNAGFLISLALAVLGSLLVLAVYRLAIGLDFRALLGNWISFLRWAAFAREFQTLERSAAYPQQNAFRQELGRTGG
jgi:uncharacterized membrane protein YeaQ/YmgE (transglycosylase-associated protein family)